MACPTLLNENKPHPLIVICAFPASGHMRGPLQIASHLACRGFSVFFLSGEQFSSKAVSAGAEPWPNAMGPITPSTIAGQYSLPQGPQRWNYQQKHIFLDGVPARHAILHECLASLGERFPGRQVVIFHDTLFLGALPYLLGAPLPQGIDTMPHVMHFHTTINWAVSHAGDVAPYGLCLPPARSEEDRARYRALSEEMRPAAREVVEYANKIFRELGAVEELKGDFLYAALLEQKDCVLLPSSPSLEYPRSDCPVGIKHIGGLPVKKQGRTHGDDGRVHGLPEWWEEVQRNTALPPNSPQRRKLVFVSQGTANINDYGELLLPTIRALAGRQDILVVATLGSPGATPPCSSSPGEEHDFAVPENTLLTDYLPYDAILPLADVFVFNGGYGGFMHGVMSGTPMVFAGTAADKGEVAARAEWAGVAVNLMTNNPSEDMLRNAVDKVLEDRRFKASVMELKTENEGMDALGTVERLIWEFVEG